MTADHVSWWRRLFDSARKAFQHEHKWERNWAWRYAALQWNCSCGARKTYTRERGEEVHE